jgi:hypothetical protein
MSTGLFLNTLFFYLLLKLTYKKNNITIQNNLDPTVIIVNLLNIILHILFNQIILLINKIKNNNYVNKIISSYNKINNKYVILRNKTLYYIIFTPLASNISIEQDYLNRIQKIITPSGITAKQSSQSMPLFINENGPIKGNSDEGIYIDCQPVGQSDETEDVVTNTNYDQSPVDLSDLLNSNWFKFIGISILMVIIILIVSALFKGFGPKSVAKNTVIPFGLMTTKT